ncbi:hypothetical protein J3Q64DRAFT_1769256 [Phycomyces blakesleeanus]|uniref:Cyclin N-terminal domain-containing protein n=2 Tax=Phycomyces blakesleeanus TaxID=4837 RepID=A0A167LHD9_PHYB8|nr:hypothetical protein PHYBLDRAFT_187922 [Phycomyces blakesleeanus NRRL 1555(-)]OAD70465.1 hypothetical protein PHYBLDRAFT_187922 [Phycomyces blakesleeanus NRRL 1555(-)]|eukprot:XP_018288505.1 hypothetical protein PHYBLDRAFT_187922 [Phycomyces blakesleeanus NRRL 1555(-)]
MKAKINLHQIKGSRIDTFRVNSPYNRPTQQRQQQQQSNNNVRPQTAYSPNYIQANLLLQAIRLNNLRRLSPGCIEHLAGYVTHAWEANTDDKTQQLTKVINNLLDSTAVEASSLDDALVKFCRNSIATPTVCPSVTLLVAIGYIERLKQKYNNIKGTSGCSQRLVMVAYMMAAKFLHANLRLIVDTNHNTNPNPNPSPPPTEPNLNPISPSRRSSEGSISSAMSSDERITLPPLTQPSPLLQPISPPTSPKSLSAYHYFPSPNTPAQQIQTHTKSSISSISISSSNSSDSNVSSPSSSPSLSYSSSRESSPIITSQQHQTSDSNNLPPLLDKNPSVKDRGYGVFRMEFEFLHFLNYNLSLSNPSSLVQWAHNMNSSSSSS